MDKVKVTITADDYNILLQTSESFRQQVINKFLVELPKEASWMVTNCIGLSKIECIKKLRIAFPMSLVDAKIMIERHLAFSKDGVATHIQTL